MKGNNKMVFCGYESDEDEQIVLRCVDKFLSLGKKPKIYAQGMLKMHHRGVYFFFSPWTNKWSFARRSGYKSWNKAESPEDFLTTINKWFDKKEVSDELEP